MGREMIMKDFLRCVKLLGMGLGTLVVMYGCSEPGSGNYDEGAKYHQTRQADLAEQQVQIALQKNADLAEGHLNFGNPYLGRGWLVQKIQLRGVTPGNEAPPLYHGLAKTREEFQRRFNSVNADIQCNLRLSEERAYICDPLSGFSIDDIRITLVSDDGNAIQAARLELSLPESKWVLCESTQECSTVHVNTIATFLYAADPESKQFTPDGLNVYLRLISDITEPSGLSNGRRSIVAGNTAYVYMNKNRPGMMSSRFEVVDYRDTNR
jgi:hypothetical protein